MVYFRLRNLDTGSTTQVELCANRLLLCVTSERFQTVISSKICISDENECYRPNCVQDVKIGKLGLTLTINLTSLNFVG